MKVQRLRLGRTRFLGTFGNWPPLPCACWFCGQYLMVCDSSPLALQIGQVYALRIGHVVFPSGPFSWWEEKTSSLSPLFLQNTHTFCRFETGAGALADGLIRRLGGKTASFRLEDALCKSDEELNGWKGPSPKWSVKESQLPDDEFSESMLSNRSRLGGNLLTPKFSPVK